MLRNCALTTSLLCAALAFNAGAENLISAKEANFKAALIYKMGGYLSWRQPKDQINYCFVGESSNAISNVLQQRQQQGSLPKPITVTNHAELDATELTACDIVYAPNSDTLATENLKALPDNVFTISNSSRALQQGFIASIELYNKKPLLSISKNNLKNSSVSVNSRFLSYVDLR